MFTKSIRNSTLWHLAPEMTRENQDFCNEKFYNADVYNQDYYKHYSQSQELNRSIGESSDSLNTSHSSLGESEKDMTTEKPPMSYVALITLAIRNSKDGRLTLSEIYDYLIKNFEFFRTTRSRGWMNAVRHNLTLNDCFVKLPRDPLMRGKGSFWCIDPDSKGMFNHGSLKRRRTRYKRAREELEVVRDIMSKNCTISSQSTTTRPEPRLHFCKPYFLNSSFTPVKLEYTPPPKKRFSNFSIDAILGKESSTDCKKPKQIFKLYSTEVWQ